MNIATIYKEMESRDNLNLAVYLGHLQDHVNSSNFDLSEVLSKDKKYIRALACVALPVKNPKVFHTLITADRHMPVFVSHMVLIKCSAELLNPVNTNEELESLLNNVIEAVRQSRFEDPGTTLSFAFGFVLGTAIKRGINAKPFFNKFDSKFIVDNDYLFSGFTSGLNANGSSLVLNDRYVYDISERYDNWEDRSRILSLSIFKAIPTEKISSVSLSYDNLKVLEYFSGRDSSYDKFLKEFKDKIQAEEIKKQAEISKQNIIQKQPQEIDLSKDDENVQLKKTIHNQQLEITSLNNELSLYKSVFAQFETLFPDLQTTLKNSDSQVLLNKIKSLVTEQKNNVNNLQQYFEEGEKQKAIKEGFKKRL